MKQEKILAWHFIQNDHYTSYGNMLVEAGKTYSTDVSPVLCKAGLHASERLLDALKYAPGGVVCRVEVWGDIKRGDDKIVAQNRHVQWMLDVTRLLDKFACDVTEETLRKHGVTDERSWNAIRVKREWVDGKATNEEREAAREAAGNAAGEAAWAAARAAAWAAAWAAAGAAAGAAAREAAGNAAWAAARAAAWAAAGNAAGAAARAAAWAAAGNAAGAAAGAAAWAGAAAREAAWEAAWAAARADLNARLEELAGSVGYQS